jgi:hypothetical protein
MKLLRIEKARDSKKKWRAVFSQHGKETFTEFGDSSAEDYTQHKDLERRTRYRIRHKRDLDTGDPTRAGFLSRFLLWGDSTSLEENLKNYKKRFNL